MYSLSLIIKMVIDDNKCIRIRYHICRPQIKMNNKVMIRIRGGPAMNAKSVNVLLMETAENK